MAYTLDISLALGSSQTGLTLSAQLVDTAGANVGGAVATGFVEIGSGNYLWHYTAFPDGHRGGVKFSSAGTLMAFVAINPEEAENTDSKTTTRASAATWSSGKADLLDAAVSSRAAIADLTPARAAKLDLLGSGQVTVATPVALSGDVTIVRGDDYLNADSRALEWTTIDATTWPDLTGASVTFTLKSHGNTLELTQAGSVVTASGATKKVRVELTAAQTVLLSLGSHKFDVQATLSNGHKVTLVRGTLLVLEDQT